QAFLTRAIWRVISAIRLVPHPERSVTHDDKNKARVRVRPGMSVIATIDTRMTPDVGESTKSARHEKSRADQKHLAAWRRRSGAQPRWKGTSHERTDFSCCLSGQGP